MAGDRRASGRARLSERAGWWLRVILGAGGLALAAYVMSGRGPAAAPRAAAPPPGAAPTAPAAPAPPARDPVLLTTPAGPRVTRSLAACPLWLPRGYQRALTEAQSADLVAQLDAWLAPGGDARAPWLDLARGVAFVESEEPHARSGPRPRHAAGEARRACGTEAQWLRTHLRASLAELACCGNVCHAPGAAAAPESWLVLRPADDGAWILDAWARVHVGAPAAAARNVRFAQRALGRLRGGRCPGEPAGRG